jgi:DNA (cytosine-5)-methyltransferase 1
VSNKNILDLFSGCGGLSLGFEQVGFRILAGIDSWKDALETFKANHKDSKTILHDLSKPDFNSISNQLNDQVNIIIGGPPCQGFSISGKRNPEDPRNKLYIGFVEAINHFKPEAFVMENVPNLASMQKGLILDSILKEFGELGYKTFHKILLASDYGVPQNRRRLFVVGFRDDVNFSFPMPKDKKVNCEEAISDLPNGGITDGMNYPCEHKSDYQQLMRKKSHQLFNHQITTHTVQTTSIIALVPDGGNYKDLPVELRNTRNVNIAWTRFNSKKPSHTIDTGHRHHFHYKFNRVPTVRESARLQSFPDNFIFYASKTSQYKQVGNAVPPLLAAELAKKILEVLK